MASEEDRANIPTAPAATSSEGRHSMRVRIDAPRDDGSEFVDGALKTAAAVLAKVRDE